MSEAAIDQSVPVSRQGLFPCDAEIARRLSIGEAKFRKIARGLEQSGFPPKDVFMGARYWPAVVAFWNKRYGVVSLSSPSLPDGGENLNEL